MRSAFIQPEKNLIEFIEQKIGKVNSSKPANKKVRDLNEEIIRILGVAKARIHEVDVKYPDLESKQTTTQLSEIWSNLTSKQDAFLQGVNAFYDGVVGIRNQVPAAATRQESIAQFIANISAGRDRGVSQSTLLGRIAADVIFGAASLIIQLPRADYANDTRRRACVEQALNEHVSRLRELGDPDVMAMWANQEAAVNEMIGQFIALELQSTQMSALAEEVIHLWENFNTVMKRYDAESIEEGDRFELIESIVKEAIQALLHAQKSVGAPLNDFGLNEFINEIQSGQEKYFNAFKSAQDKLHAGIKIVCEFAEVQMNEEKDAEFCSSSSDSDSSSDSCSSSDSDSDSDSDSESSVSNSSVLSRAGLFSRSSSRSTASNDSGIDRLLGGRSKRDRDSDDDRPLKRARFH